VPFSAIKGFLDPSVQFELRFEVTQRPAAAADVDAPQSVETLPAGPAVPQQMATETAAKAVDADLGKGDDEAAPMAQVVSLDAFRKK
jgi:hypothetical protein